MAPVITDENVQLAIDHLDSHPGCSASATSFQFKVHTSDVLSSPYLVYGGDRRHPSGRASAASNTVPTKQNTNVRSSEVGGVTSTCSSDYDSMCSADVKPLDLGRCSSKTVVDPTSKEKLASGIRRISTILRPQQLETCASGAIV
ncbi:hypothetical protein HPB48_015682 [Haemaphysalis longicornis]|uniref:Uncharacterized protein n=1 Tax=Haemaphysalis longicornis TaxID=44386 RepID=A0A9J6G9P3_HAELO|nr:hypothetical protein HPB48_015682 [Haemaphysalis longicornis]